MRAALAPYRLGRQCLVGAPLPDVEAVVGHLGAVQSQEHLMAPWAVARRCGATAADVAEALEDGRLLRTHVLRPTWHYVLPDDLMDLQAATGPRVRAYLSGHARRVGIGPTALQEAAEAVTDVVRRHGPLTRSAIAEHLGELAMVHTGDALAHVVMTAELDGAIASGPMRGRQHTYRALDLPASTRSEEELLAWIATTYARGHGPLTDRDLAWWSSMTLTQARRAIALAGLEEVELEGHRLFTDRAPVPVDVPHVLLLANFDEVISHARDAALREEVGPGYDAMMRATGLLLVDGRLAGHWARTRRAEHVDVTVRTAARLPTATRRAIEEEADAFGRFLGLDARVQLTV